MSITSMGDPRVDALYGLPPADFVKERNSLAKALKVEGKAGDAKAVAALRRPAAAAWAIDQVAHERPADLAALLAADDRLRASQARAAVPGELRAAMQEQREKLRAVLRAAEEKLPASSRAAQGRAIQATLLGAVSGGAELRERLVRGTLDEELQAPGFDALAGLSPSLAAEAKAAPPPTASERAVKKSEREETRKAKAAREAARREARSLEREARRLETKAELAERAAAQAQQAAAQAKEAAARTEERAAQAKQAATDSSAAAAGARKRAGEARGRAGL